MMTVVDKLVITEEPLVKREDYGSVVRLILNRPRVYNALSRASFHLLQEYLEAIDRDQSIKVVIIGALGRAFCAGHDLKELMSLRDSRDSVYKVFEQNMRLMLTIYRLRQPVIAQVQGMAAAGGCQLVAMCDLAVAGESANFALSSINFGLFGALPLVALTRTVGRKVAMEIAMAGRPLSAQRAWKIGLINRVVTDEELPEVTQALAQSIANKPFYLISLAKKVFYQHLSDPIERAYEDCCQVMTDNFMNEVGQEGITAFLQKRKPSWTVT